MTLQITYQDGTEIYTIVDELKMNKNEEWLHYLQDDTWEELEEWSEIKSIYINSRPAYLRPSNRYDRSNDLEPDYPYLDGE